MGLPLTRRRALGSHHAVRAADGNRAQFERAKVMLLHTGRHALVLAGKVQFKDRLTDRLTPVNQMVHFCMGVGGP